MTATRPSTGTSPKPHLVPASITAGPWITPRSEEGQAIQRSYLWTTDGRIIERTADEFGRDERLVAYEIPDVEDDADNGFYEPPKLGRLIGPCVIRQDA